MASSWMIVKLLALLLLALVVGEGRGSLGAGAEQVTSEPQDKTGEHKTSQNHLAEESSKNEDSDSEHSHNEWTYTNQGGWSSNYPLCEGSNLRQSPIDIITDNVVLRPKMKLEFIDYNQKVKFQLKNTHHSISLTPIAAVTQPSVRLNWLPKDNEFELQEIHFHWGDGLNKGSEHEINNQRAAAEMHMVHYLKGINKSDIGNIENSVVVVGVLIESDLVGHMKLERLVQNAAQVNGTDSECMSDSPEELINLLPNFHQSFYTYNGSLTTPPCYEVVTWIVLSEPVYMANDRLIQLSNLETIIKDKRRKIASNHRDIQPLLDRPVYASFNTSELASPTLAGAKMHGKMFDVAMKQYWKKVKGIRGNVKKVMKRISEARKELLKYLKSRNASNSSEVYNVNV